MDFAEALYISELRSAVAGHFSYRRVAWEMYQAVAKKHPALASFFRIEDVNQPVDLRPLCRLAVDMVISFGTRVVECLGGVMGEDASPR